MGGNPNDVIIADLDNNGTFDIATADSVSADEGNISVLLGIGLGDSFVLTGTYQVNRDPRQMIAAHLNKDDAIDLIAVNVESAPHGALSILMGKGNGTFEDSRIQPVGEVPVNVVAGHFNDDEFTDLVTVNATDEINFLQGLGDGSFRFEVPYPTPGIPIDLVANDFDNDGNLDVATINSSSDISLFMGNGMGIFDLARSYLIGSDPVGLITKDLNTDGILDFATANQKLDMVSILLGNEDWESLNARNYHTPRGRKELVRGDFNRDGFLDIGVGNEDPDNVSILLGNSEGSFEALNAIQLGGSPDYVISDDLDLNGDLDLVIASSCCTVYVLHGKGNGTFDPAIQYPAGRIPTDLMVFDLDGDENKDIVVLLSVDRAIAVYLGDGLGFFENPLNIFLGVDGNDFVAADFDVNGDIDFAISSFDSEEVQIYPGVGNLNFLPPEKYPIERPGSILFEDIDNNGNLDLVVLSAFSPLSGSLNILHGNGDLSFQDPISLECGIDPRTVVCADINTDGIKDLITGNQETTEISVFLGRENDDPRGPLSIPVGVSTTSLLFEDFNRDGLLDIAAEVVSGVTIFFQEDHDCNNNSRPDSCDISGGTSADLNKNSLPDECESDCNDNGIPDIFEIDSGNGFDCNDNLILDSCEDNPELAVDIDKDGTPDICEPDCNENDLPDDFEILQALVEDCNENNIPDSCEITNGDTPDTNNNGIPDNCEIGEQISGDCNQDGNINISDAICLFGSLFLGNPRDFPCGNGKSDHPSNVLLLDRPTYNSRVDIADGIDLLNFLFNDNTPSTSGTQLSQCTSISFCPENPHCLQE